MSTKLLSESLQYFHETTLIKTFYPKGTPLYLEGNPILGIHFLHQGKVKLYRNEIDGKDIILKIIHSPEFIGHRCFFARKQYGMSAAVLEDSEIYFIEKSHVIESLGKDNSLNMHFIDIFSKELLATENKMSSLMRKNVGQRLAEFLLILHNEKEQSSTSDIKLILSREEIASTIGTSSETVTRYMTKFKEKGLISEDDHYLRILKPDQLLIRSNSPHD